MGLIQLKAKEGMYLTQSADVEDRQFVTAIAGVSVKESDWRDATLEEKEEYEALKAVEHEAEQIAQEERMLEHSLEDEIISEEISE